MEDRNDGLPYATAGWDVARLGEVAKIVSGITLGPQPLGDKLTRRVPYVRVANVKDGWLDLDDVYEIDATENEIEKCSLRRGDILTAPKVVMPTSWAGARFGRSDCLNASIRITSFASAYRQRGSATISFPSKLGSPSTGKRISSLTPNKRPVSPSSSARC